MQNLTRLFASTFHPDSNTRQDAEQQLAKISALPGFCTNLLHLIVDQNVEFSSRQAASIYFKNTVKQHWKDLQIVEKETIQNGIISLLGKSPNSIRNQILEGIGQILSAEEAKPWPQYLPQSLQYIKSGQLENVLAGTLAALELVKCYRWKMTNKEKKPLYDMLVVDAYPTLLHLARTIINDRDMHGNPEAILLAKTVAKLFNSMIYSFLPDLLHDLSNLSPWLNYFVLTCKVSAPYVGSDENWMKLQKWSMYNLNHIFSRYGNSKSDIFKDGYKKFSKLFLSNFSGHLVDFVLSEIQEHVDGNEIPRKTLFSLLCLLTDCLRPKQTWKVLEKTISQIIEKLVFPLMCMNEDDEERWNDDPLEFIQRHSDPLENFHSPSSGAASFLAVLYREHKKVASALIKNLVSVTISSNDRKLVDGCFNVLYSLASYLEEDESFIQIIPQLFSSYVIPALSCPEPILQFRSCFVLAGFCSADNKDKIVFSINGSEGWQSSFIQVVKLLSLPHNLPVRIAAANAVEQMIEKESVQSCSADLVPFLMERMVELTNTIDSESCTTTMERLVEIYPERVLPFSSQLAHSLTSTFLKQCADISSADIETDTSDKVIAGMGVLKTLMTLFLAVPTDSGKMSDSSRTLLVELEKYAVVCVKEIFAKDVFDLYEDGFELLEIATFCRREISADMWELVPVVDAFIKENGVDYISEVYPFLDNIVSFAAQVVIENHQIIEFILQFSQMCLKDGTDEYDRALGFQLLQSFLLHCKGSVSRMFSQILDIVITYSSDSKQGVSFRVHAIEVIMAMFNSDYMCAYQLLNDKRSMFQVFISGMIELTPHFVRVYDRKLAILTTCCILNNHFNINNLDENATWSSALIKALIVHLNELPKAEAARKALEDEDSNDDDSDNDQDMESFKDGYGNRYEDEDDDEEVDGEDEQSYQFNSNNNNNDNIDNFDEEEEEEDYENVGALHENIDDETAIDGIDVRKCVKEVLSNIPPQFLLTIPLTEEEKATLSLL